MPDRRGSRFVLEVLFLLGLAVALTLADLRPLEIAGIMLVGWVIVAVLEWAAWREEPHFGSGLPPRYYVPQVNLPPAQPLEQVSAGYPETRDEAPTWIASASMRAELLGEWPVAAPPVSAPEPTVAEPEPEPELDPDPWTIPEELPAAPLGELDPQPNAAPVVLPAPELEEVSDTAPAAPEAPVVARVSDALDVAEPAPEPEPEPAPEPEPVVAVAEEVPDTVEPAPVRLPEPLLDVVLQRSVQRTARYSLDPLADPQPRKRFGRGGAPPAAVLDVPARPEGARALPGRPNRQD